MNTKRVCIDGLGIALFVTLSLCLRVPVFENYYLCLGYTVMAVYCYSIGILDGILVGTLGTILYCFLINGLRGMPGWSLGNVVIGLILGIAFKYSKMLKNKFFQYVLCVIAIVLACLFGILGVKSIVEVFLYAQPFVLRTANNIYAFISDVVVLVISIPLCTFLDLRVKNFNRES